MFEFHLKEINRKGSFVQERKFCLRKEVLSKKGSHKSRSSEKGSLIPGKVYLCSRNGNVCYKGRKFMLQDSGKEV